MADRARLKGQQQHEHWFLYRSQQLYIYVLQLLTITRAPSSIYTEREREKEKELHERYILMFYSCQTSLCCRCWTAIPIYYIYGVSSFSSIKICTYPCMHKWKAYIDPEGGRLAFVTSSTGQINFCMGSIAQQQTPENHTQKESLYPKSINIRTARI
jgi:hypothetical protein